MSKLSYSEHCFNFFSQKSVWTHSNIYAHSRPENLKNSRPKKLVKSNKSISRKKFFLQFQKWPKINFCTREKFKTARNAISRKKNWFTSFNEVFFAWTFLNFLARCAGCGNSSATNCHWLLQQRWPQRCNWFSYWVFWRGWRVWPFEISIDT